MRILQSVAMITFLFCSITGPSVFAKGKCGHGGQPGPLISEYVASPLLAPDYKLIPGNYAEGVADTLVYLKNKDLNLFLDFAAKNDDNTINAVIEIPSGSNAKFETSVTTGRMFWELKNGAPRVVKFLGYPGNYGMVPRTLGGDGDPLDVVVIGGIMLRGTVAAVKVIGVLRLIDGGEADDKLIAVIPGTPLGGLNSMEELNAQYPGVSSIIETWLTNYKGPDGGLSSGGFGEVGEAMQILEDAIANFDNNF